MENALRDKETNAVTCLLTQVEVDPDDPVFENPSKPIGPFFNEEEAKKIGAELSWLMKKNSGRGWRHVVPSPKPKHVCDISGTNSGSARLLPSSPVAAVAFRFVRNPNGVRKGVTAVIDKDLTSALMANVLGIDTLMILTAVPKVAIHFGTEKEECLDRVTLQEIRALLYGRTFFRRQHGTKNRCCNPVSRKVAASGLLSAKSIKPCRR